MRVIVPQVPVIVEAGASGEFEPIERYDFDTISPGEISTFAQLRLRFPVGFDDTDPIAGFFNPTVYVENLRWQSQVAWNWKMDTPAAIVDDTPLVGTDLLPRLFTKTSNIDKTSFYETPPEGPVLQAFQLQIETGGAANFYNTINANESDPRLIFQFDRQTDQLLDDDAPMGESDHLWTFSQVDLYVTVPVRISGVTYYSRFKLGWIADEDLDMSDYQDTKEFKKGKPTATAVTFISEIKAEIKGQLATTDPWFLKKGVHQDVTTAEGYLVFTEKNVQRPIETFEISMEWQTNAGHWCRFVMPKAQIFFKEAYKPGANEIAKYNFTIMPLVTQNRVVCKREISKSPIQRVEVPFGYTIA